jgi:hypothetical protein
VYENKGQYDNLSGKRANILRKYVLSVGHFVWKQMHFAEIRGELSMKRRHWRAKHRWPAPPGAPGTIGVPHSVLPPVPGFLVG